MAELYHHGVLGQKWGIRRYQNADGSLTNAGKARYSNEISIKDYKYTKLRGVGVRDYQRSLKRNEEVYADAVSRKARYNKSAQKKMDQMLNRAKKIGWDISKDPHDSGDRKLIKKSDEFLDKLARTNAEINRIKNIESRTWKLMGEASKQGYTVTTEPRYILTMKRGHTTAQLMFGVVGQLAYSTVLAAKGDPGFVQGNKYKVSRG